MVDDLAYDDLVSLYDLSYQSILLAASKFQLE